MRFTPVLGLLPVLLVTFACSPAAPEQTGGNSAAVSAGCTASRADILAGTSAARQNAIQRGFAWLDDNVPYSQSASHEGYRTDCSGFVSMCWELGTSTDTAALYAGGTYDSDLASWDDLLPADALVHRSNGAGHVVLFLGWEPGKTGVCVLEQASTASDMQFRVRSLASLQSQGFKPIRASVLADDTGGAADVAVAGTTTTDPPAADDAPPADPNTPADPGTPDSGAPDPGNCTAFAAIDVCNEALLTRGIECGLVQDACGNTVNCDAVVGFGCKAPKTCTAAQKCVAPACQAAPAATLCANEKATHGLQCGTISDGCSGKVNCDVVPSFGCAKGETCNASHACVKGSGKTPATTTDPPAPSGTVAPVGDPGDNAPVVGADESPTAPTKSAKSATSSAASPMASSGCSASSSKRAGGAGGQALPMLALAFAASLARRRARRTA